MFFNRNNLSFTGNETANKGTILLYSKIKLNITVCNPNLLIGLEYG